jgi:acetyl-CoA synthetase
MDHGIDTAKVYPVSAAIGAETRLQGMDAYKAMYNASIKNPDEFWRQVSQRISWFQPYTYVMKGGFEEGDIAWFVNGKLNVCYNCVDRHVERQPDALAIIHEGNEPGEVRKLTYRELLREVCKMSNALKSIGVRKGDTVCIYMPMCPEAVVAMLACARIGAIHSVVFAGFSADALTERIQDASSRVVITANEGKRGPKGVPLKKTVDEALLRCPGVQHVLVHRHTSTACEMSADRDQWLHTLLESQRPYCPCEWMDSEDGLFILYTSGSTGKPKGVMHTTGGYLTYVSMTHDYVLNLNPDAQGATSFVYGCVADVGWITGHSYIVYGPLSNGVTTLLFESTPLYPGPDRYWQMVQTHRVNVLYAAPTALRALMKYGNEHVTKWDRSSLKVLGSVGEPINPAAWEWFYHVVGEGRCPIVDTYWQTETGGIVLTPLPGVTPLKPGSATLPFFGIQPEILDPQTGHVITERECKGVLVLKTPWPSMARTVYNNHQRYLSAYMRPYPGYYFTGDECYRDQDGYYWIIGRVDDVLNVSGHRLGTAEVESALVSHNGCAEAAVVAVPHELKGQALFAYCCLKDGFEDAEGELSNELRLQVRRRIGAIAVPDYLVIVPGLPKTRSGKIMRRILRKIANHESKPEQLGDVSTLAEPQVVSQLIDIVEKYLSAHSTQHSS